MSRSAGAALALALSALIALGMGGGGCRSAAPIPAEATPGPAATAPSPPAGPAGPCLPSETADLVEVMAQLPFAGRDGEAKVVPVTRGSPRWMSAFNAALAWVNDDCPAFAEFAKQMGYRAREIVDRPTGRRHWLLSEEAGRYNGTFVFRAPAERDKGRPLAITAPHLGSDFSDGRAVRLYRETEAAVLLTNSAHRCGLEACSGCTSEPGYACGGCTRASDAAHSVDHMMMAVYAALEGTRKDLLRFEYHGASREAAGIEGCPATAQLSQGSRQRLLPVEDDGSYPSRLWRALGARLGDRCVCYHQRDSACRLPGTGSVFGRLTNEEPAGPFDPCGQPSTRLSRRYAHLDGHDVPVEVLAAALQEAVPLPAP